MRISRGTISLPPADTRSSPRLKEMSTSTTSRPITSGRRRIFSSGDHRNGASAYQPCDSTVEGKEKFDGARREKLIEATAGIEPADEGFADLCLTTWLRRLKHNNTEKIRAD